MMRPGYSLKYIKGNPMNKEFHTSKQIEPDASLLTFAEEMRPFHNHVGIVGDYMLCRLIGVHDDQMDHYYVVSHMFEHGLNQTKFSAVGAFESLKGKLERYDQLDHMLAMNGAPKTQEFTVTTEEVEDFNLPEM
jgi:hypothetical protein